MFCYFGGKYRIAPKYPKPLRDTIIEPFAGAAGYSTRYYQRKVILYDLDPVIYGVWDYLIKSSRQDILNLPLGMDGFENQCQEAKWLIGFWLGKGRAQPGKSPSSWMKGGTRPNSYWGAVIRERIANDSQLIKHWKIVNGSYETISNLEATWFVDPPYQVAGKSYKFNKIDYGMLSEWCLERKGQAIVCENQGAGWLPFVDFVTTRSTPRYNAVGVSKEVIWTNI